MSSQLGPSGFVAPRLIGHRGAAALAPENTLVSIRAAAESGVSWIEIDAKLARDDVPVLIHDSTLDRTTTSLGPVVAKTSAELGRLDAGSKFDPRFAGEPIPTLQQCLDECRRLGLGLGNCRWRPARPPARPYCRHPKLWQRLGANGIAALRGKRH